MTTRKKPTAKQTNPRTSANAIEEPPPPKPTACEKKGKGCHWIVAAPNGREAQGKCKVCGAERMFRNSFEYSSWYGTKNSSGRRPGRPPGRPKKNAAK